jgi:hypothetical protein
MSESEPIPEVTKGWTEWPPGSKRVAHAEVGPIYMSDSSGNAYLYDPENEPWEVGQSGSHELILSMKQAECLRDRLSEILGE